MIIKETYIYYVLRRYILELSKQIHYYIFRSFNKLYLNECDQSSQFVHRHFVHLLQCSFEDLSDFMQNSY